MNLLKDSWLPIVRRDGTKEDIAIWQLLDNYSTNPVVDILSPRPDFRNAIYQLLIGIVQVAALPEDEEHWSDLYYSPWGSEEFKDKVLKYEQCFEIDSEGPAFMQDFELPEESKEETLGNLFINLPANEHYIAVDSKYCKNEPQKINPYWAAVALFTLQTFAPPGGRGNRTGLRGGGPLTTVLLPTAPQASLWKKIWLNIIDEQSTIKLTGDLRKMEKSDIFPWLKPTKVSNDGSELHPSECHPFHMYFGMPRRIRLLFKKTSGKCDITGLQSDVIVEGYLTRHSGNNYSGTWRHPLNTYSLDTNGVLISRKPKLGGICYRHWLDLSLKTDDILPAIVIELSQESAYRRDIIRNQGATLWAAGYAMENMKALCWYDATMPVYPFDPRTAKLISGFVQQIVATTQDLAGDVKSKIKSAWFSSPKDVKGDVAFIETSFWQNTEADFYSLLNNLVQDPISVSLKNELIQRWMKILSAQAYTLFDQWAIAQQEDGLDMKRVIKARIDIDKSVGKMKKQLKTMITSE